MTMDLTGILGEITCANQAALEEATASSNQQIPAGDFPRTQSALRLVDAGWQDHSPVYYDALDALTQSVPRAAAHKNVPLQPQFYADIARRALQQMTDDEMAGLLALDPAAVKSAQIALSLALDELAATMIANFVAYIRGIENPGHWFIAPIVDAHLEAIKREGTLVVWPDLLETAIKYTQAVPPDAHMNVTDPDNG
jgi:hypothetical protein